MKFNFSIGVFYIALVLVVTSCVNEETPIEITLLTQKIESDGERYPKTVDTLLFPEMSGDTVNYIPQLTLKRIDLSKEITAPLKVEQGKVAVFLQQSLDKEAIAEGMDGMKIAKPFTEPNATLNAASISTLIAKFGVKNCFVYAPKVKQAAITDSTSVFQDMTVLKAAMVKHANRTQQTKFLVLYDLDIKLIWQCGISNERAIDTLHDLKREPVGCGISNEGARDTTKVEIVIPPLPSKLNAPTNLSPNNRLAENTLTTTLSWNKNNIGATYEVKLVNVNTGATLLNYENIGDNNTKWVSGLQNGQNYRWSVRTRRGFAKVESNSTTFFVAAPAPLKAPTDLSPSNKQKLPANTSSTTLSWNKNNSDGVTYEVKLVKIENSVETILLDYVNVGDSNTKKVAGLKMSDKYRWRVRAIKNGLPNAESTEATFSILYKLDTPQKIPVEDLKQ
jgi:NACalpha-BTF3-like transcription factor